MYIFVPSILKSKPIGTVSWVPTVTLKPEYDAVEISHGVDRLYSCTPLLVFPTTYIFVPSGLNVKPLVLPSSVPISKNPVAVMYDADETSQGVDRLYSCTRLDAYPIIYILVPSGLNVTSCGSDS